MARRGVVFRGVKRRATAFSAAQVNTIRLPAGTAAKPVRARSLKIVQRGRVR